MYFRQWLEAVEDERYAFKAIFMAGGPGSGKSFLSQKLFPDFNKANSDNIQVLLTKMTRPRQPKLYALQNNFVNPTSPDFHTNLARAQRLNNARCELWTKQGYPVVIDITSRDTNLVSSINGRLKSLGYDTGMIFVQSSLEKAIRRNKKREAEGGHVADESFLRDAWEKAQENIPFYSKMFGDKFQDIDNDQDYRTLDPNARRQFDRKINVVMGRVLNPMLSRGEIARRKELLCKVA